MKGVSPGRHGSDFRRFARRFIPEQGGIPSSLPSRVFVGAKEAAAAPCRSR